MSTFRAIRCGGWQVGLQFVLFATVILGAQAARADDNDMLALLKKSGHMVLLRHSNSPESPPDATVVNFKDCATQRNLDDAGRAQARRTGDAFCKHGVNKVRLASSQFCRTQETAKLTKLGSVAPLLALNQVYLADLGGMKEAAEKSDKL